jgi:hypothetical protein
MKILLAAAASLALLAGCAAAPQLSPRGALQHTEMEQQMQAMQQMREKLAAATPAERQDLMQEQMKLMHRGMDMLALIGPGEGEAGAAAGAMEMRMQMMQSMMLMMMDRMDPMQPR